MFSEIKKQLADGRQGKLKRSKWASFILYLFLTLTILSPIFNAVAALNQDIFEVVKQTMPNITQNHLLILSFLGVLASLGLFGAFKWNYHGVILYFLSIMIAFLVNANILGFSASIVGLVGPLLVFISLCYGNKS